MAKQHRKMPGGKSKQPISRHPLFPAIVALWFGALFGMASLAIRPSLLESAVLAMGIDALVPAAAPPLGMTSRILLALALAGLGGLFGAAIARRIGRPKPEVHMRRRGAPVASHGTATGKEAAGGSRRRSLAVEADTSRPDFEEHAPLPGGAPQILNVSDFDLERPAAHGRPALHAEARDDAALDLGGFAMPDPVEAIVPPARQEFRPASPFQAAADQDFHATAPVRPFAQPGFRLPEAQPIEPAAYAPLPTPELPRLGAGHDDEAWVQESVINSLSNRAPPLFGARAAAAFSEPPAPAALDEAEAPSLLRPFAARPEVPVQAPVATTADFAAPDAGHDADRATPSAAASPVAHEAPAFAPPVGAQAERIATSGLNDLSQVELIERLALSLMRRRQTAPAPEAAPVGLPVAEVAPAAEAAPAPLPSFAPAPAAGLHRLAADDIAPAAFAPPPISIPAALRPVGLDFHDDDDDGIAGFVPPRHFVLPAAASIAPPADLPADAAAPLPPVPDAAEIPPTAEPAAALDERDDASEDPVELEDGYSSLLELSRRTPARQPFVRIDEPESPDAAIEPVVIFPGHAPQPSRFAAVQPGSDGPAAAPHRPFDTPGSATAIGTGVVAGQQDAQETERALRAALASLQRMSGAA